MEKILKYMQNNKGETAVIAFVVMEVVALAMIVRYTDYTWYDVWIDLKEG